jgi:hypothetical protein
MLMKEMV